MHNNLCLQLRGDLCCMLFGWTQMNFLKPHVLKQHLQL